MIRSNSDRCTQKVRDLTPGPWKRQASSGMASTTHFSQICFWYLHIHGGTLWHKEQWWNEEHAIDICCDELSCPSRDWNVDNIFVFFFFPFSQINISEVLISHLMICVSWISPAPLTFTVMIFLAAQEEETSTTYVDAFFTSETNNLIDQHITGVSMSYLELHHTWSTKMLIRILELLAVDVQLYQGSDNALCMHDCKDVELDRWVKTWNNSSIKRQFEQKIRAPKKETN